MKKIFEQAVKFATIGGATNEITGVLRGFDDTNVKCVRIEMTIDDNQPFWEALSPALKAALIKEAMEESQSVAEVVIENHLRHLLGRVEHVDANTYSVGLFVDHNKTAQEAASNAWGLSEWGCILGAGLLACGAIYAASAKLRG